MVGMPQKVKQGLTGCYAWAPTGNSKEPNNLTSIQIKWLRDDRPDL